MSSSNGTSARGFRNGNNGSNSGGKGRSTVKITPDEAKYSQEEFLNPESDDKGMWVSLVCRCTPLIQRDLQVIRDAKRFPYQTIPDILRHAVIRHIQWCHQLEENMPKHFLAGLNAVNEVIRDAEMMSSIQQTFTRLDNMIQTYLAAGDEVEGVRLLTSARSQMVKIPDCRWKQQFLAEFTAKYTRYLSPGAGVEGGPVTRTNVVPMRASGF